MTKSRSLLLVLSLLLTSACQTSSLTEEESIPIPESAVPFRGALREIDADQSAISFVGKSNIINHEGKFTDYALEIALDPSDPANLERAEISTKISIASVVVDAPGLQAHLLREEFFNVERFPDATFQSRSIVSKGGHLYDITGVLTIKGMAKTVTLAATITEDSLTMHYDLPRKEFGIGNDSYGNKLLEPLVPVDVKIVFK